MKLSIYIREETNALECVSNGAIMAVELVLAIVANLIVFLALLALFDSILGWMGELVGQPGWSFEVVLWPNLFLIKFSPFSAYSRLFIFPVGLCDGRYQSKGDILRCPIDGHEDGVE